MWSHSSIFAVIAFVFTLCSASTNVHDISKSGSNLRGDLDRTHVSNRRLEEDLTNVSSAAFKARAAETYRKVLPCLKQAWMFDNSVEYSFPDDAQQHYEEILSRTEKFRHAPVHEYAGYEGPWIENIFIREFKDKPLHYFNGFIPIFVQWIDTQILRGRHFDHIHNELNGILRPNVLYLAVSQGDVGLGKIGSSHPNLMALAAGGYGHVPIPLIRGEINASTPIDGNYNQEIGFFGNYRQYSRPTILGQISEAASEYNMTFAQGQGAHWKLEMEKTKFNLAPRGYGRSSFRFAECIQLGRVPVFLYDDLPWIPYNGTNITAESYGFVGGLTNAPQTLKELVKSMKNLTQDEYQDKLRRVQDARWFFTYPGLIAEIEKFIKDPFGPEGEMILRQ